MNKLRTKAERNKIIDEFIKECIEEGSVPNIIKLIKSNDPDERYLGNLINQIGKKNICEKYNLKATTKYSVKQVNQVLSEFAEECRINNKMPTNRELISNEKGKQIHLFILKVHKSKANFAKHYNLEELYNKTSNKRQRLNKYYGMTKEEIYQEHKALVNKELKKINGKTILTREDFNRVKVECNLGKFRVLKYIKEEGIIYMPRSAYKLIKELNDNKHKGIKALRNIYSDKKNNTPKMFFYNRYGTIDLIKILDSLEINY